MLLTITLIGEQATDLGFLLGKHPDRVHRTELSWGHATVCFRWRSRGTARRP